MKALIERYQSEYYRNRSSELTSTSTPIAP
jgi:hypothetical protein